MNQCPTHLAIPTACLTIGRINCMMIYFFLKSLIFSFTIHDPLETYLDMFYTDNPHHKSERKITEVIFS